MLIFIAITTFTAALPLHIKPLSYALSGLLGFFIMSILAVGLDFGCEVTHPVPANNSTGVMITYSQILCAIQILAASFILSSTREGENPMTYKKKMEALIVCAILIASIATGLICATYTKEDLRKMKLDMQEESTNAATM